MRYLILLLSIWAVLATSALAASPAVAAAGAGSSTTSPTKTDDDTKADDPTDTAIVKADSDTPIAKPSTEKGTPADAAGSTDELPITKPNNNATSGDTPADAATTAGTGGKTGTPTGAAKSAGDGTGETGYSTNPGDTGPVIIIIDGGSDTGGGPDTRSPRGYRIGGPHGAPGPPLTEARPLRMICIAGGTQGLYGGRGAGLEYLQAQPNARVALGGAFSAVACGTNDPAGVLASEIPHMNYTEIGSSRSEAIAFHAVVAAKVAGHVWIRGLLGIATWRESTLVQSNATNWYYRIDEQADAKLLLGAGLMVAPGVVIDYDTVRGVTVGAVVAF